MKDKRILLIASFAKSLVHFRGDFIKELVSKGYKVYVASPEMNAEKNKPIYAQLVALKAYTLEINLQRTGLNIFKDLETIKEIKKIISAHKIDIVFPYTIKPVIYGSIAARKLQVPVFSLITGLGYTFSGVTLKARLLQKVSESLYRNALKRNKVVIFQNKDDHRLFIDKKVIKKTQAYEIVDGSGVNLEAYNFREKNNTDNDAIKFVFVGRLIREKGIELYLKAAKLLKEKHPKAEFHILGARLQGAASSVDLELLSSCKEKEIVIHHGSQPSVEEYLTSSDVFVLPTYYREGVPRSILEALSIGMPIITTDTPGCRETVIEDKNGFLIRPQSLDELVKAMSHFLENRHAVKEMGIASRKLAEKKFDVHLINKKLINIIEEHL